MAGDFLAGASATDDERRAFLAAYEAQLSDWKSKALADLRETLSRDGAALH